MCRILGGRRRHSGSPGGHVAHRDDGVIEILVTATGHVFETNLNAVVVPARQRMLKIIEIGRCSTGAEELVGSILDAELDFGTLREFTQVDGTGPIVDADQVLCGEIVGRRTTVAGFPATATGATQ